jgi:hypothetical protein
VFLLTGCGLHWNYAGPEVDLYDGPTLNDEDVAIIDQGLGCWRCVTWIRYAGKTEKIYEIPKNKGATTFDYPNKIRLLPGLYEMRISYRGRKSTLAVHAGSVDLQPGRIYLVRNDTCILLCLRYRSFVWMEDADNGEILLGRRM